MINEWITSDMEFTMHNSQEFTDLCRELTYTDVDQALNTLKIHQTTAAKRIIPSEHEPLTVLHKHVHDCCRLVRSSQSSHLTLPLARRGRPHFPTRSSRLLCSHCTEIKRQQQLDLFPTQAKSPSNQIFQITVNLNLSSDVQTALNNHQYHPDQMLVWKINTSDGNTIDLSYDANSLNDNEKKILLEETIRKLEAILNNRSTTNTDTSHDHFDFTYRTLQRTIDILSSSSSSHNSV